MSPVVVRPKHGPTGPQVPFLTSSLGSRFDAIDDDAARSRAVLEFYLSRVARFAFPDPVKVQVTLTDGPSDGGLDGYIVDTSSRSVILAQCKWYASGAKLSFKDSMDLHDFVTARLHPKNTASLSPEVRAFIERFHDHYTSYSVALAYITTLPLDGTALKQYQTLGLPLDIVDRDGLAAKYYSVLSEQDEVHNEATFSIVGGGHLTFRATLPATERLAGGVVEVVQCAVRGVDLKRAFKSYDDDIFSRNLRFEVKGKINSEMEENAKSDMRFAFYVLHNGISITCESFKFVKGDDSSIPASDQPYVAACVSKGINDFVVLRDFQVVNGAQTTFTLSRLDDGLVSDVVLPCKISRTTDSSTASLIAECNNTQNAVGSWDLASNSEELTLLQNYASVLPEPVFVQRKKGEHWTNVRFVTPNKPGPERSLIAKDIYQATLSWFGSPGPAYSRPGSVIAPGTQVYRQIASLPDLDLPVIAGLLGLWEKRHESTEYEFLNYWQQWFVGSVGHVYRHNLAQPEREKFKAKALGKDCAELWTALHKYLACAMDKFLRAFPSGTDVQDVFKNTIATWDGASFDVTPQGTWKYVDPNIHDRAFPLMREKQKGVVSIQFYDVNFAVLACHLDNWIRTNPMSLPL